MANDNDDYDEIIQSVYTRTYHNFHCLALYIAEN